MTDAIKKAGTTEVVPCWHSILIRIELIGSGHGYPDRSERVENPHRAAVGFQYLIKSLVAVRRFIDTSSTKLYASLGHFGVHHLARVFGARFTSPVFRSM